VSDDDLLHPRLGRIRGGCGTRTPRLFKAQVLAAAQAGGHVGRTWPGRANTRRPGSGRGRGGVAAWRAAERRLSGGRGRRVIVKARVVRQGFRARAGSLRAHLAYLRREGVTRDGARARLFDAGGDDADAAAFARRAEGDRHHFRFIVSPEDAAEMGDLRAFTRELVGQMERDLGTRLDWVALDHWNTDNPHVHVIVRGIVGGDGSDLVIHRDYIARGMRERAAELVTVELGPQPEWEVRRKLAAEVGAERWTRLDAALRRAAERAEGGVLDFRPEAGASPADGGDGHRDLLIGRLQRLERMGLAHPVGPARWRLAAEAEPTLREMGLRGDVIRTMQRAFAREVAGDPDRGAADYAIRHPADRGTIIGRLVEKGLDDELSGRAYLVVDGTDGRAHYVRLGDLAEVEGTPVGAVVAVGPARVRPADHAVAELAAGAGGVYDPERHRALLERKGRRHADPEAVVEGHVRRLEALRRAPGGGIAERLPDGRWKIADDFAARARAHDVKRGAAAEVEVRTLSELPLERQVAARGATWLDRELVACGKTELAHAGFGQQVREALERRAEHLAGEGLARREGRRVVFARDLLDTLRDRELAGAVARVARETGLAHHQPGEGEHVSGIYRRRLDLASGRFALIEDGDRFALVPWRPVVERELGREVSGVVRGGGVSWTLGRARGLEIG
jgi:type IV secretory pathway VirD2 relaxase